MPDPIIKYQIYNKEGKSAFVDGSLFDKNVNGFAEKYKDATIRMVDPNGNSRNVPISMYEEAKRRGGRAYTANFVKKQNAVQNEPAQQESPAASPQSPVQQSAQQPAVQPVNTAPVAQPAPQQEVVQPVDSPAVVQPVSIDSANAQRVDTASRMAPAVQAPSVQPSPSVSQREFVGLRHSDKPFGTVPGRNAIAEAQKRVDVRKIIRENAEKGFEGFYQKNVAGGFRSEKSAAEERSRSKTIEPTLQSVYSPFQNWSVNARNAVVEARETDPEKVANTVLNNIDEKALSDYVLRRMGIDPSISQEEQTEVSQGDSARIKDSTAEMRDKVLGELQERMYNEYKEAKAPKSVLEYILSSAMKNNLSTRLLTAIINRAAGSRGVLQQLEGQALQEYGEKQSSFARGAAAAGSIMMDAPWFKGVGMIGNAARAGITNLFAGGGKMVMNAIGNRSLGTIADVASKRWASMNPFVNVAAGSIGSGVTFGLYDTAGEAINEFQNGDLSLGGLASAFGHGFLTGSAVGLLGGTISAATRNASKAKKLVADVGGFAGETALFTGLEGYEQMKEKHIGVADVDWASIAGKNAAMLGVLKLQSIPQIRERYKSTGDILTKDDKEALKAQGIDPDKWFGLDMLSKLSEERNYSLQRDGQQAKDAGLDNGAFREFLANENIPINTRRRVSYLMCGVATPEPRAYGMEPGQDENGFFINTYTDNGKLIDRKTFKNQSDFNSAFEDVSGRVQLNTIGALHAMSRVKALFFNESLLSVAEEAGIELTEISEAVRRVRDGKATQTDRKIVERVNELMEQKANANGDDVENRSANAVLNSTGIDITKALAKKNSQRTPLEKQAVSEYVQRLQEELGLNGENTAENAQSNEENASNGAENAENFTETGAGTEENVQNPAESTPEGADNVQNFGENVQNPAENVQNHPESTVDQTPGGSSDPELTLRERAKAEYLEGNREGVRDTALRYRLSKDNLAAAGYAGDYSDLDEIASDPTTPPELKQAAIEYMDAHDAIGGYYDAIDEQVAQNVEKYKATMEPLVDQNTGMITFGTDTTTGKRIYVTSSKGRTGMYWVVDENGENKTLKYIREIKDMTARDPEKIYAEFQQQAAQQAKAELDAITSASMNVGDKVSLSLDDPENVGSIVAVNPDGSLLVKDNLGKTVTATREQLADIQDKVGMRDILQKEQFKQERQQRQDSIEETLKGVGIVPGKPITLAQEEEGGTFSPYQAVVDGFENGMVKMHLHDEGPMYFFQMEPEELISQFSKNRELEEAGRMQAEEARMAEEKAKAEAEAAEEARREAELQEELQKIAKNRLVKTEDGKYDFEKSKPEDVAAYIREEIGLRNAGKMLEKTMAPIIKEIQAFDDAIENGDLTLSEAADAKVRRDWAQDRLDFWNEVKEDVDSLIKNEKVTDLTKEGKAPRERKYKPLEDARDRFSDIPEAVDALSDLSPRNLEEVASEMLWSGEVKLLQNDDTSAGHTIKGYKSHTGFSQEEATSMLRYSATRENGGIGIEHFGELVLDRANALGVQYDRSDANAGLDAVVNLLSGIGRDNPIANYIANQRIAEAKAIADAYYRQREDDCWNQYGMGYYEYEAMQEAIWDYADKVKATIDEAEEFFFSQDADRMAEEKRNTELLNSDYFNTFAEEFKLAQDAYFKDLENEESNDNDQSRAASGIGNSGEVQQGQRPDGLPGERMEGEEMQSSPESNVVGNVNVPESSEVSGENAGELSGESEISKPGRTRRSFKPLLNGDKTNPQNEVDPVQEKFDKEKASFVNTPEGNAYAKALQESNNVRETVAKIVAPVAEYADGYKDWAGRQYKKNNTAIEVGGKYDDLDATATSIGSVNERRRNARMAEYRRSAEERMEWVDTLLKRCGIPAEERNSYLPDGFKSFDELISDQGLKFQLNSKQTPEDSEKIVSRMKDSAEEMRIIEFNEENFNKEFSNGEVATPIGKVKIGKNQFSKIEKGDNGTRGTRFGMAAPTLERPDIILEKHSPKDGAERDTKYLFVKSFKKGNDRVYFFEHVTVSKEGNEVSVSSHDIEASKVKKELKENNLLWTRFSVKSDSSDKNQGLDNQQGMKSEPVENGLNPQSNLFNGKDTALSSENQISSEKSSDTEFPENSFEAQNEEKIDELSGRIGDLDAEIEQLQEKMESDGDELSRFTTEQAIISKTARRNNLQSELDGLQQANEISRQEMKVPEKLEDRPVESVISNKEKIQDFGEKIGMAPSYEKGRKIALDAEKGVSLQDPTGAYTTRDGRNVVYKQLNLFDNEGEATEEAKARQDEASDTGTQKTEGAQDSEKAQEMPYLQDGGAGTSVPGAGSGDIQREAISLGSPLRNLNPGEFCNVERQYTENGHYSFTSRTNRIESVEDVAYIFKSLEDKAVENSFVALVKDGKPYVIHLGIGGINEATVDLRLVVPAVHDINPDEIYLVHNHPSGRLVASRPDAKLQDKLVNLFGYNKVKPAIIIDTNSGKYAVFDELGNTDIYDKEGSIPENEIPVKVFSFDKQLYYNDWKPGKSRKIGSDEIASFVTTQRTGQRGKLSALILSNNLDLTGNIHLPYSDIVGNEKEIAGEINYMVAKMGGTGAVIYGNRDLDIRRVGTISQYISNAGFKLYDVIAIEEQNASYRSASDESFLEPEPKYGIDKDSMYEQAVRDGNLDKARKMLRQAAAENGYSDNTDYQGSVAFNGTAPGSNGYFDTREERIEAFENGDFEGTQSFGDYTEAGLDGWDLGWQLSNPAPASHGIPSTLESIRNLSGVARGQGKTIKMYRAVPADVKEESFRNGDWVTPSRRYAEYHITLQDWDGGRIIEQEVPVDDIWWDGNDINEWGYDDGKQYAYRNTENNRKLLDITYDENGDLIPLSERFNQDNPDTLHEDEPEYGRHLAGVHNIYADKLRKAMKLGGLANPSTAVIDTNKNDFNSYGEISLVMPSSMVDAKTGRNAGTWTADAWTPVFPQIVKKIPDGGYDLLNKDMEVLDMEGSRDIWSRTRNDLSNYLERDNSPYGLSFWYLTEKGLNPEVVRFDSGVPEEDKELYSKLTANDTKRAYELSKDEIRQLLGIYAKSRFNTIKDKPGTADEILSLYQGLREEWVEGLKDPNIKSFIKRHLRDSIEGVDTYGVPYGILSDFTYAMGNAIRKDGKIDANATLGRAENKVKKAYDAEFLNWLDDKMQKYGVQEKFYAGMDKNGHAIYKPNTLEAVSRHMKSQGRNGSLDWSTTGNLIATVASRVRTLKQIRNASGNLVATEQEHKDFKEKWGDILFDIADECYRISSDPNAGFARLAEALREDNPALYLKKEYGVELSTEAKENLSQFVYEVQNKFPTGYFETKFERPVMLEEFAAAVVPGNVADDIRSGLQKAGLKVIEYEPGNEESRKAAMQEAFADPEVRFSESAPMAEGNGTVRSSSTSHDDVRKELDSLSSAFHTPVIYHPTLDDVPAGWRKKKGVFNTETGEIHLIGPNLKDVKDAHVTFLHEVTAHNGLRRMLGDKEFNGLCDRVWAGAMDKESQERCFINAFARNSRRTIDEIQREAADEYMANLSESEVKPSFWKRIKAWIKNLFHKLGINLRMTDDDIQYMLWKSRNRLMEGDDLETTIRKTAADSRKRRQMDVRAAETKEKQDWETVVQSFDQASRTNDDAGLPDSSNPVIGAKLGKIENIAKSLNGLSGEISKKSLSPDDLLNRIAGSLGINNQDRAKSKYPKEAITVGNGNEITIRIANHSANVSHYTEPWNINAKDVNYGIVIQLNSVRFKHDKDVDYLEFVYSPSISQSTQIALVNGIRHLIETGSISKMPKPMLVNPSGSYRDIAKEINNGNPQIRFRTSTELDRTIPGWNDGSVREDGRDSTQITGTVSTYKKIGKWMQDNGMKGHTILDASSGLGLGTKALREMGFDVEDVEPFPSESREAPTYKSYDDITKKYDMVISNAVLNVIPDDWRNNVLHSMADKVKPGGKLFINVRDAGEIKGVKNKVELDSPHELLITNPDGSPRHYQRFWTKQELIDYVKGELGDGWKVEAANVKNSGVNNGRPVICTKLTGNGGPGERYRSDEPIINEQAIEALQMLYPEKTREQILDEHSELLAEYALTPAEELSSLIEKFGSDERRIFDRAADYLTQANPVSELSGDEFQKEEGNRLTDRVAKLFEEQGGKAKSPFGTVILDRKSAKNSINHGMSRDKAAAFASVKDVIEKGIEILPLRNWRVHGKAEKTGMVAAPITINGERRICVVEVISNKKDKHLYTHEAFVLDDSSLPSAKRIPESGVPSYSGAAHESVANVLKNFLKEEFGKRKPVFIDYKSFNERFSTGRPIKKKNESQKDYLDRLREWEDTINRVVDENPDMKSMEQINDEIAALTLEKMKATGDTSAIDERVEELRKQLKEHGDNLDQEDKDRVEYIKNDEESLSDEEKAEKFTDNQELNIEKDVDAYTRRVFQEQMKENLADTSDLGIRRTIKESIIERRNILEVSNYDDAVFFKDIERRTTEEQRKALPFILEGYPLDELPDDLKNRLERFKTELPSKREVIALLRMLAHDAAEAVLVEGNMKNEFDRLEASLSDTVDSETSVLEHGAISDREWFHNQRQGATFSLDSLNPQTPEGTVIKNKYRSIYTEHPEKLPETTGLLTDAVSKYYNSNLADLALIDYRDLKNMLMHLKPDTGGVEVTPELKQVALEIRQWFDDVYEMLKGAGFFDAENGSVHLDNYVTHIWKFDTPSSEMMSKYEERLRTSSPYVKHRLINSLREGIEMGLSPKFDDIVKIMSQYGRYANEAVVNRGLINNLLGFSINKMPVLMEKTKAISGYKEMPGATLEKYKVHPSAYRMLQAVFLPSETSDDVNLRGISGMFRVTSAFMKKMVLNASFFHHIALTESIIANTNPVYAMNILLNKIILETAKTKKLPAYQDESVTRDAVAHLVKLGVTDDYNVNYINSTFEAFAKGLEFVDMKAIDTLDKWIGDHPTAKRVPKALINEIFQPVIDFVRVVDVAQQGMDTLLWDMLHDAYKLWTYKYMADEIRSRNLSDKKQEERLLNSAGQWINDSFGGQHWEVIGMSPQFVRFLSKYLLSADWTVSAMFRQSFSMAGFGNLYNVAHPLGVVSDAFHAFANGDSQFDQMRGINRWKQFCEEWKDWVQNAYLTEEAKFRLKKSYRNTLMGWITTFGFYGLVGALARFVDVQTQEKIAEERRAAGDKDYLSPYEILYPHGMKWYDYTFPGNTYGNKTYLFAGRYPDGTERYAREGKQYREIVEMFYGRDGFEVPGAFIDKMVGKLNPMWQLIVETGGGAMNSKFVNREIRDAKPGVERTMAILNNMVEGFVPWSLVGEWNPLNHFMPNVKGMRPYRARTLMEEGLINKDLKLMEEVRKACIMNGLDTETIFKAAKQNVYLEYRKSLMDGVNDLQDAIKQFDTEPDLGRKDRLGKYIDKQLGAELHGQLGQTEFEHMIAEALEGRGNSKDDDDAYLKYQTSDDRAEDVRFKKAMATLKPIYNEWNDLSGQDKQEYYDYHRREIDSYKSFRKARSGVNLLKKSLKEGRRDPEEIMEDIREIRRKALRNAASLK